MRALLLTALLSLPGSLSAQHWISRELCTVETPEIVEDLFEPMGYDAALARAAAIPNGTGKYWRIESPDGAVSHLWGTMHSSAPRVLDLPTQVLDAIQSAEVLAVEVDFTKQTRTQLMNQHRQDGQYRPARTAFNFDTSGVDPEIITLIRSRTHGLGWGFEAPDFLTYGALAELLLYHPCEDFNGGIIPIQDWYIQTIATVAGAEVIGLENPNRIRTYLDRPSNENTAIAMLSIYGAYLAEENFNAGMRTGEALYLTGQFALWDALDLNFAQKTLGHARGTQISEQLDAYLLEERNHIFVDNAGPALAEGDVFIAVGAGHLPGEQGMVALLREAGFTVTRIPLRGETPS